MVSKKDPICGMKGHIKMHGHYFCSDNCIKKYEVKKNIKSKSGIGVYVFGILVSIAIIWITQITGIMLLFMGIVFVLLACLKFLDLKGFAVAFAMYDVIAKRSKTYAYVYPFIEFAIGLAFMFNFYIVAAASLTVLIMAVGLIGVTDNLFFAKNKVKCACLGTKIKVPLTKFTFFEDIVMGIMGLMILFM
jgi:YHS domain-containing protein